MIPGIFNDVVGPVMRGPSSSHSAAALRIGRLCRDLMGGNPEEVLVVYQSGDALATTHRSQGSDMGLMGGLLGFDADDPRLPGAGDLLEEARIRFRTEVKDTGDTRSNLYEIYLGNSTEQHHLKARSVGGGAIQLLELDGRTMEYSGDVYLAIDFMAGGGWKAERSIEEPDRGEGTRILSPVVPLIPAHEGKLPFGSWKEMMGFAREGKLDAWEAAVAYESAYGKIGPQEVLGRMRKIARVMRRSVEEGLEGTHYADRIYGDQSRMYRESMDRGELSPDSALHRITLYVSAIMEVKSAMGVIVAAPTAGSCGTFAGAVLGMADSMEAGEEERIRALLAGSLVGLFIAKGATFSAEIGGCQAECGAGGGMAAAAIASLMGGDLERCMNAASLALQNILGLICDPVAARVEAPCLGKNISNAANALSCANLALAGYDPLIPLDEVIETMDKVGRALPYELRCTALGGLAITPSARELEKKLKK